MGGHYPVFHIANMKIKRSHRSTATLTNQNTWQLGACTVSWQHWVNGTVSGWACIYQSFRAPTPPMVPTRFPSLPEPCSGDSGPYTHQSWQRPAFSMLELAYHPVWCPFPFPEAPLCPQTLVPNPPLQNTYPSLLSMLPSPCPLLPDPGLYILEHL